MENFSHNASVCDIILGSSNFSANHFNFHFSVCDINLRSSNFHPNFFYKVSQIYFVLYAFTLRLNFNHFLNPCLFHLVDVDPFKKLSLVEKVRLVDVNLVWKRQWLTSTMCEKGSGHLPFSNWSTSVDVHLTALFITPACHDIFKGPLKFFWK